jgi:hypothetical protein
LLNLAAGEFPHWPDLAPGWVVYWPLVAGAWAALLAILPALSPARRSVAVALVLVVDLLAFVVPYPDVRPAADVFPHSPLADYIRGHNPDGQRTYDPETEVTLGGNLLGVGGSGASVYGIPSVRGYNPLDVARVRQFLAYVADIQEPQRAFASNFTHPVTEAFPVKNRKLLDLLGTRYLITTPDNPMVDPTWVPRATDPAPRVYAFPAGGIRDLPPLTAYENTTVLPRAFMVSRAEPEAGEADVLAQLVRTDLHTAATLADWEPDRDPVPNGAVGPVALRSHRPNRIDLELDGESGGLLVLADPWYPGWKCWVDGTEVPIWKADYAFRGVMVPSGAREVVFRFEPRSYRVGRVVSLAMLGVVLLAFLVAFNRPARSAPAQKTHAR